MYTFLWPDQPYVPYMLLPINNLPKVYLEDQAQKENQERKHFTYCTTTYYTVQDRNWC